MNLPSPAARRGMVLITVQWLTLILVVFAVSLGVSGGLSARSTAHWDARGRAYFAAYSALEMQLAALEAETPGTPTLAPAADASATEPFVLDPNEEIVFLPPTLQDECAKIDLNTADRETLLRLPGFTEELADAVIAWRASSGQSGYSTEFDSQYQSQQPPYEAAHRPFQSVEELLLVQGMSAEMLYGTALRQERLSPAERARIDWPRGSNPPSDPTLIDLLTVGSIARNLASDGEPRIALGQQGQSRSAAGVADGRTSSGQPQSETDQRALADQLQRRLEARLSRQELTLVVRAVAGQETPRSFEQLWGQVGNNRRVMAVLADVLDLPGQDQGGAAGGGAREGGSPQGNPGGPSGGRSPGGGGPGGSPGGSPGEGRRGVSGLNRTTAATWPALFPSPVVLAQLPGGGGQPAPSPEPGVNDPSDSVQASVPSVAPLRGVVNLNTAPVELLAALSPVTPELAQAIVARRQSAPFASRGDLLEIEEVTPALFNALVNRVTVFSDRFQVFSVGMVQGRDIAVHLTAWVDRSSGRCVITHFRQDN
ncbi:MAG: general secretion pathway protein GspK [Armatimonadetes bacterium]|nr:general secretion pathway protein GspK [Armatimonadota bacterium]